MDALIGCSGFVGSNLARQRSFHGLYNSANIQEIVDKNYNTIYCAGVPGTKWLANKEPRDDMAKIRRLLDHLTRTHCKKLVLISTVDVYINPAGVDETTPIILEGLHPYGCHRARVEDFVRDNFSDYHIVRLPAIYGDGLKKNLVYDLLHQHYLHWTHRDSVFQFYHLKNLDRDLNTVIQSGIRLINFNAEPLSARELARECFGLEFDNITPAPPLHYDVRTIWSRLFSQHSPYMYTKEQVLREMSCFISRNNRPNV